jgi:hypothetical protein
LMVRDSGRPEPLDLPDPAIGGIGLYGFWTPWACRELRIRSPELYWPKEMDPTILNGTWRVPPVVKTN